MWIVPSERISTHCVVFKSPGSQVYLNFLFNGHFFTDAQMHFRELSVKLCQLKSLFRTTTYTEYFFTFLLRMREFANFITKRNYLMIVDQLFCKHSISIKIFHLSFLSQYELFFHKGTYVCMLLHLSARTKMWGLRSQLSN